MLPGCPFTPRRRTRSGLFPVFRSVESTTVIATVGSSQGKRVPELSPLMYMPRISVGRWHETSTAQTNRIVCGRMRFLLDPTLPPNQDQLERRMNRLKSRYITEAVPADNATLKKRIC